MVLLTERMIPRSGLAFRAAEFHVPDVNRAVHQGIDLEWRILSIADPWFRVIRCSVGHHWKLSAGTKDIELGHDASCRTRVSKEIFADPVMIVRYLAAVPSWNGASPPCHSAGRSRNEEDGRVEFTIGDKFHAR